MPTLFGSKWHTHMCIKFYFSSSATDTGFFCQRICVNTVHTCCAQTSQRGVRSENLLLLNTSRKVRTPNFQTANTSRQKKGGEEIPFSNAHNTRPHHPEPSSSKPELALSSFLLLFLLPSPLFTYVQLLLLPYVARAYAGTTHMMRIAVLHPSPFPSLMRKEGRKPGDPSPSLRPSSSSSPKSIERATEAALLCHVLALTPPPSSSSSPILSCW